MSTAFTGKWTQTDRSHVEELLDVYGVPADRRDGAKKNLLEQTMEMNISGETGTMINTTPAGSQTMEFTLGKPFDYFMSSGRKVQGILTKESDTKIHLALSDPADPKFKGSAVSEVSGDNLTMDFTVGPVVSAGKYKRS